MIRRRNVRKVTKFKRCVKAISPVIATLLMIAIAVVASLVAYFWVSGYIGKTTTTVGHQITIQSATRVQGTYQFLVVYVQNTGQGTVHLKQDGSVYVNSALHLITHSPKGTAVANGALVPITAGQTIEVVTDYLTSPGEQLKIKIVTYEGTSMEITDNGGNTQTISNGGNGRYILTVGTVGQGIVTKNPIQPGDSYSAGQEVQLIASPQAGWQFDHWTGAIQGSANPGSLTMASNKSVIATFTQKQYSLDIQITGSGGKPKTPNQPTNKIGTQVQLTATPGTGYTFTGFTGDITTTTSPAAVTIDENPQVTATFTQITTTYSLTVTANPAEGGAVTRNSTGPYNLNDVVTLTPHANAGYTFTKWAGDLAGTAQPGQITITGNMIVTADFDPATVSLTLSVNPQYAGSITTNPAGPYHYGETVQLTAVPNSPFDFATWSQDASGITNPTSMTLDGNKAVTANFQFKEYPLDIQIIGNGTVAKSPDKTTYHLGDIVQLTATSDLGWIFVGYTGDATSTGNSNIITVTVDETPSVVATFTQEEYSLTVTSNPSAGGPVARNNTGPYHLNDVVMLTPNPVYGYSFLNWQGDLTGTDNPAYITITGNIALTANFAANPVSLTLLSNPPNAGTINAVPTGPYTFGVQVGLTGVPVAGYVFASWGSNLSGTTNPSQITLYGDTTVTANFAPKEYPLNINTVGQGTVAKSPDQATYHLNDQVTLTANPSGGWTFAGWTGAVTGTVSTATVTIEGNTQVTATFTQQQFTLTTTANPTNGGTINGYTQHTQTYLSNQQVNLQAVAATGYTFTGWAGALGGSANPASLTITGNMVVTANFAANVVQLTLIVSPSGAGAITPNSTGSYHYGDHVQLTAVPVTGYSFDSWSGGATGSDNPITITLNGDKTVTATFTLDPIQQVTSNSFDGPIWDLGINDWGNPPWALAANQGYNSPNAAWSSGSNQNLVGAFSTDPLDTSGATAIYVSFDYKVSTNAPSDFQIRWSGNPVDAHDNTWHLVASLGGNSGWTHYTLTITNPTAFTTHFRFQFLTQNLGSSEAVWIDNVAITKQIS